jgi:hypothetical protein
LETRTLHIRSSGIVDGGELTYTADPKTGDLAVKGSIKNRLKDLTVDEAIRVDPSLLRSENVKPGMELEIGQLKIHVLSIAPGGWATCSLVLKGKVPCTGTAVFDLSKETIALESIAAHGSVLLWTVDVVASA